MKEIRMFEISSLEDLRTQRRWDCENPPRLFRKQRQIESFKISKTHAAHAFWLTHFVPRDPMHLA
jgi:hypothetical protein